MKLAIFNGSPRNRKSNSAILIQQFLTGYHRVTKSKVPVHYIANRKKMKEHKEIFRKAENVIIVFPLYTDCMPGIVKEFFENIANENFPHPKKIGFIVQSGFPEAIHSTFVERYLRKFTMRLKCEYLGTIIKGGVEGIQIMPPAMTGKLFKRFQKLGEHFARTGEFSPEIQKVLSKPYKMSKFRRLGFQLLNMTGLTNYYWNSNLKKNKAFHRRYDQPFANINASKT